MGDPDDGIRGPARPRRHRGRRPGPLERRPPAAAAAGRRRRLRDAPARGRGGPRPRAAAWSAGPAAAGRRQRTPRRPGLCRRRPAAARGALGDRGRAVPPVLGRVLRPGRPGPQGRPDVRRLPRPAPRTQHARALRPAGGRHPGLVGAALRRGRARPARPARPGRGRARPTAHRRRCGPAAPSPPRPARTARRPTPGPRPDRCRRRPSTLPAGPAPRAAPAGASDEGSSPR